MSIGSEFTLLNDDRMTASPHQNESTNTTTITGKNGLQKNGDFFQLLVDTGDITILRHESFGSYKQLAKYFANSKKVLNASLLEPVNSKKCKKKHSNDGTTPLSETDSMFKNGVTKGMKNYVLLHFADEKPGSLLDCLPCVGNKKRKRNGSSSSNLLPWLRIATPTKVYEMIERVVLDDDRHGTPINSKTLNFVHLLNLPNVTWILSDQIRDVSDTLMNVIVLPLNSSTSYEIENHYLIPALCKRGEDNEIVWVVKHDSEKNKSAEKLHQYTSPTEGSRRASKKKLFDAPSFKPNAEVQIHSSPMNNDDKVEDSDHDYEKYCDDRLALCTGDYIFNVHDIKSPFFDNFRDMKTNSVCPSSTAGSRTDDKIVIAEGGGTLRLLLQSNFHILEILLRPSTYRNFENEIYNYNANKTDATKKVKVVITSNAVLKELLEYKKIGPGTILASVKIPSNTEISTQFKDSKSTLMPKESDSSRSVSTADGNIEWEAESLSTPCNEETISFNTKQTSISYKQKRNYRRVLVLDGLTDAENVGSLIRSASCFGVDLIILSRNCLNCWNRRSIRVSMGHIFHIPIHICGTNEELEDILSKFNNCPNMQTFAAVVQGETQYLHEVKMLNKDSDLGIQSEPRYVLVVGNEQFGVSERLRKACKTQLKIKMPDHVDSLNVNIASAICLHHLFNLSNSFTE